MNVIKKIRANINNYSDGQKKIALYILDNQESIANLSSQTLAEQAGVSQSSVIKFIQLLGLAGYTQFKLNLTASVSQKQLTQSSFQPLHNKINRNDSIKTIAEKLAAEKYQAIMDTTLGINFTMLEQVIEQIINAKRIQIVGIGNSALVAKDIAYKLQKLALSVTSELDSHAQLALSQSLTDNDLLLAISYSGNKKEINLAAKAAKENGATVVAITSLQNSTLRGLADYVLDTVADEVHWRSSAISSRTAQNTITDLIFMGTVQAIGEKAEKNIKNSSDIIKKLTI